MMLINKLGLIFYDFVCRSCGFRRSRTRRSSKAAWLYLRVTALCGYGVTLPPVPMPILTKFSLWPPADCDLKRYFLFKTVGGAAGGFSRSYDALEPKAAIERWPGAELSDGLTDGASLCLIRP